VRLKKQAQLIEVSGLSLQISRPAPALNVAFSPDIRRAQIRRGKRGTWQVRFAGDSSWQPIHSERLAVRGQMLRLGLTPVPYDLEIIPNPKLGLDVVSRMDLETYLHGVLPAEMPAAWPLEALKAQAVAARSFVMRMAYDRRNKYFDVESTVFDQVYKFFGQAENRPEWSEKIDRALRETRGEVLLDTKRRILKAFYSADCGCQSEDPRFVWGKIDAFVSVKDPSCMTRAPSLWRLSLDREEVRHRLIAALALPEEAGLRTLQVRGRTPSGRVAQVAAAFDIEGKVRRVDLKAQEFRRIFGFDKIQSADFSLLWSARELQIHGRGIGHGVGLCQRGARSLAEKGMTYRDILKLYYPRAHLYSAKRI
jgi:stage II sporulation protein D